MKKYLHYLIAASIVVAGGLSLVALPTPAGAVNAAQKACEGAGGTLKNGKCVQSGVDTLEMSIQEIVNLLFFVIGTIAVIVIIIGGIKFITADGDASKIKSARETIMYAVVGLVVAILAYAIVGFVVNRLT